MKLSRLNNAGIQEFAAYLTRLKESPAEPVPTHLLSDLAFGEETGDEVEINQKKFATRYELGSYLVHELVRCDQSKLSADKGIWAWLALWYFDDLCPADAQGNRNPVKTYNYIPSPQHQDYHRHAIRTTYLLVREHGETVRYMLSNPLSKRGEFTEQLTGRSYFINCKGIIEAANLLYADNNRNTWKRGAASKKGGAVRRFGLVVRQFELTYDVISLDGPAIVSLLPKEFSAFLPQPV